VKPWAGLARIGFALPGTTLIGDYHPAAAPLDRRRLSLEIGRFLVRAEGLAFDASIHVEGVAERAPASGVVVGSRPCFEYRVVFEGDDGVQYALGLSQRLERITFRALTELRGELTRAEPEAEVVGPACLRFDWRGRFA
jgi:hypothetical protein